MTQPLNQGNKLEVYKPAQTIQTKDKLSRTALIVVLLFIRKHFNNPTAEKITLSLTDVYEALGYADKDNYRYIKHILRELTSSLIEWSAFDEKGKNEDWGVCAWCAEARLRDGMITYAFAPTLRTILSKSDKLWHATLSLPIMATLRSKYAVRLYEECKLYFFEHRQQGETPDRSLEAWREYFGVNDVTSYTSMSELNRNVIAPAIAEINDKTDLQISVVFRKVGRKIVGMKFVLKRNPKFNVKPFAYNPQPEAHDRVVSAKMPQVLKDRIRRNRAERAAEINAQAPLKTLPDLLGRWRSN